MVLLIGEGGVDERVTVRGQSDLHAKLSSVHFDDGTVWNNQTVALDSIPNDGTVLTHLGGSGADTIDGTSDIDVMDGGLGDDLLRGADTYRRAGSGDDTIAEVGTTSDVDTIVLVGLDPEDVILGRVGSHLSITIIATGEVLTVEYHFNDPSVGIEQIKFADSTTWDRGQILSVAWLIGTSAHETISGTSSDDIIDGRAGDDRLVGQGGNDTYLFAAGSGNDRIVEGGASTDGDGDTVKLIGLNLADLQPGRAGSDLTVKIISSDETLTVEGQFSGSNGIERFEFADGSSFDRGQIQSAAWVIGTAAAETIYGSAGPDTIDGKGGDDRLNGDDGGDSYIYGVGSGNDTITEWTDDTGTDIVKLVGLNTSDVLLSRDGGDLFIRINSSGETLKVGMQFVAGTGGIEQLVFASNASSPTPWNVSALSMYW